MKFSVKWLICLFCLFAAVQPSWALGEKKVAVLPFTVHSAENIDYVRQGIGDMLSSRLSVNEKIEVVNRDAVLAAIKETSGKELTLADVYGLGKKLNADFVVWGSITKIGNSLSIDGRLIDITAYKAALSIATQSPTMDEVIPKINEFARKIEAHLLGTSPTATETTPPAPQEIIVSRKPAAPPTREGEIISGMKDSKKGYLYRFDKSRFHQRRPASRQEDVSGKANSFPPSSKGWTSGTSTATG